MFYSAGPFPSGFVFSRVCEGEVVVPPYEVEPKLSHDEASAPYR